MKEANQFSPKPPLDGFAVRTLEDALSQSPTKTINVRINDTLYQLSREGRWFKLALLSKKRTVKRATILETLSEVYNQFMHGHTWQIATA